MSLITAIYITLGVIAVIAVGWHVQEIRRINREIDAIDARIMDKLAKKSPESSGQ